MTNFKQYFSNIIVIGFLILLGINNVFRPIDQNHQLINMIGLMLILFVLLNQLKSRFFNKNK